MIMFLQEGEGKRKSWCQYPEMQEQNYGRPYILRSPQQKALPFLDRFPSTMVKNMHLEVNKGWSNPSSLPATLCDSR